MERSTPTATEAWSSAATAAVCLLPVAALWWHAPDGRGVPVGFHVAGAIVAAVGLLKLCTVVAMRAPSRARAVFRATLGGVLGGSALTYIAVLAAFNVEERRFEREWVRATDEWASEQTARLMVTAAYLATLSIESGAGAEAGTVDGRYLLARYATLLGPHEGGGDSQKLLSPFGAEVSVLDAKDDRRVVVATSVPQHACRGVTLRLVATAGAASVMVAGVRASSRRVAEVSAACEAGDWVPVWIVASGSTALRPFPFGIGAEDAREVEALWPVPAG